MTDVLHLSWAVARSGWRATWNRSIRFSRMKSGLILLGVQLLFFYFLARRAPAMVLATTPDGMGGLLALMGVQMAWFGLMYGFARGQQQLYQGILVPLFQMSPARPLGFLLGRVIESVPMRMWSCFLWAWVYSRTVLPENRPATVLLLAVFGLTVAMVSHMAGLLLLTYWGRISPKTMRNGNMLFGVLTLALVTWATIYLSQNGTVTDLSLTMRQYRIPIFSLLVLVTGIPGLFLLLAVAVRPDRVEDLYRQGVHQLIELGESDVTRPGRSLWLPLGDGVTRAVLSREWLELMRARVVRIQGLIWVAGTVGVYFTGRAMAGQPMERVIQFVGAYALFAWFIAFGHWVVRTFEKERRTIHLYRLAAVSGSRLVVAKFISLFVPSALLVLISALVGALAARLDLPDSFALLLWTLGGLAAGVFGGFGITAATVDQDPEETEAANGPRQEGAAAPPGGGAWWALARTLGLLICAGLPIWVGAGQPGLTPSLPLSYLVPVLVLLPFGLLTGGYLILKRTWEQHG